MDVEPEMVIWAVALVVTGALVASVFGWMLFRAGQLSHPSPLIVSLTLLTGVALIGALIGHDTDAYNLAAVGIGALAGSLAVVYRGGNERSPDRGPDRPAHPDLSPPRRDPAEDGGPDGP